MKPVPKPLPDLNNLSLEEQVAQMIVVRASSHLFDRQISEAALEPPNATLQHWLHDLGIGGVILSGASAGEVFLRSQQLQDWAKVPLLIAADVEEGVGQHFAGASWFPPSMAIGAIAAKDPYKAQLYAQQMGAVVAHEAVAIGINWLLAPVVDVNNNPQNPVINVRAFGDTPQLVSELACAFIQGAKRYPVLTTAKHFPGHGDATTNSSLGLPVVPHSPPRLATVELPPFKAAIAVGVDTVISAHLLIPAWDSQHPATLSHSVLTELLREYLMFEGLVVTDALMIGNSDEAPIMAVEAGADILLMPPNPETAIRAICEAVAQGRLSRERIRSSLERIWKAKHQVLPRSQAESQGAGEPGRLAQTFHAEFPTRNFKRLTGTSSYTTEHPLYQLAQPNAQDIVTKILQDSQVVGGSLPLHLESLDGSHKLRNLILVDDILGCDFLGRNVPAVVLPKQLGYELQLVDRHTPLPQDDITASIAAQPTLFQLFIRENPFRGSAGLMPIAQAWVKKLLRTDTLQALVIYGSPYALRAFLPAVPPNTPYVFSYGQLPEAQAIALEVLFSQTLSTSEFSVFL